jgi:hypothetical protein
MKAYEETSKRERGGDGEGGGRERQGEGECVCVCVSMCICVCASLRGHARLRVRMCEYALLNKCQQYWEKICCFVHIQYLYFLNIQEYEIPIVLGKKYLVLEAALN